jgi:pimeloyl-ACP methyl ester carboxylesterase
LDQLGHRGAFRVAGVSWGGALAQQIAKQYGARVSRLVLMATGAGPLMVPGRPSALVRILTPARYLSRSFMERHAATLYGGELRGRPDLAKAIADLTRPPSRLTYLQQVISIAQFSSAWWLHRIRCPALVMHGDDDPLVHTLNAHVLAALLGNARLHVVRGGGHLFLAFRPEETARVVTEFLDESEGVVPASTSRGGSALSS